MSKIEYIGQKADIWALGVCLYVMLVGKFPFKGVNDNDLFKKIKKVKIFKIFINIIKRVHWIFLVTYPHQDLIYCNLF